MESKRGIKQIGNNSFLYYNSPEIIYNIQLNIEEENKIKITFIKIKQKKSLIYQCLIPKDYFYLNYEEKSTNEILKNLSYLAYNQNFNVIECEDNQKNIKIIFNFDKENNKECNLELLDDSNSSIDNAPDFNSKTNLLDEINKLNNTISEQKEIIDNLKNREKALLKRIEKLENNNKILIEYVKSKKNNNKNVNENIDSNNDYIKNNVLYNDNNNNNSNYINDVGRMIQKCK